MAGTRKTAGSTACYDRVLSRPFLAEHWYRGFVAAAISLFIGVLLLSYLADFELRISAILVTPFSIFLLVSAVTQHSRFELKANKLAYRTCLWVVGFRFGRWQPLPAIEAIIIRHRLNRYFLPLEGGSEAQIGFTASEDKWQVLLRVVGSPIGIVAAYVPYSQAIVNAETLGKLLCLPVIMES